MGGVLKCLIFSCLQNPMGYESEQDSSAWAKDHCANSLSLLLNL